MALINIADITFDELIYPRKLIEGTQEPYWGYAAKLARDMRAGSVLPAITLARLHGKNLLIDGYNRMLAALQNDRTQIECEFIDVANEDEAYVQAITRNIKHGNNLTEIDIARAAVKLQERFGHSEIETAAILNMPPLELRKIMIERVTKTPTGSLVLKQMFVGQKVPATMTDDSQRIFTVRSQLQLCRQFRALVESDLLMLENHQVLDELNKIADTLNRMRRRR